MAKVNNKKRIGKSQHYGKIQLKSQCFEKVNISSQKSTLKIVNASHNSQHSNMVNVSSHLLVILVVASSLAKLVFGDFL